MTRKKVKRKRYLVIGVVYRELCIERERERERVEEKRDRVKREKVKREKVKRRQKGIEQRENKTSRQGIQDNKTRTQ